MNNSGENSMEANLNSCSVPLTITPDLLKQMKEAVESDAKNQVAFQACARTDPFEVSLKKVIGHEDLQQFFQEKVEMEGKPVTDQESTGRCWIFAMLNAARIPLMAKLNLEEFEFSPSFLFFYDKLERCNFFLNNVVIALENKEELSGRLMQFLLSDPIPDGGQWDMLQNIVTKYGLVPKKCFYDTLSSTSSAKMNNILATKLREFCKVLREMVSDGFTTSKIQATIGGQMTQIYRILCICLGTPPSTIVWQYYNKSKEYHSVGPITPIEFYKSYVKSHFDLESKVCIINDPRPNNAYGALYSVEYLGNMVGGRKVLYNNQEISVLLRLVGESLKKGMPVWFGCEVAKRFDRKKGILSLKMHDFETVLGCEVDLSMSKADRILYGSSAMTHAMVFTAASFDENGKVSKLRVENSWGENHGNKGYIVMTSEWFEEYVFEVVVDKSVVPELVLEVFDKTPIVLPAWDPMGNLACNNCGKELDAQ